MKFVRYADTSQNVHHGLLQEDQVLCIQQAPAGGLKEWLALGGDTLKDISARARKASPRIALADVCLLAPIPAPDKFLGLGGNYASHLREIEHLGIKAPETQVWFNKQVSCVAGPFADVSIPAASRCVDYEGELAVVIGRRCRNVTAERAHEVIGGYMACNDVSVRDVQLRTPTMTLGKSFDTHGPTGPCLVTPDEIADPQQLRIRTWVNGELRQDGNTDEMRYSIRDQIEELSHVFTLAPGDLLATGTPAGVAAAMRPPRFLRSGDVVRIEIEGIGAIENRFVPERPGVRIA